MGENGHVLLPSCIFCLKSYNNINLYLFIKAMSFLLKILLSFIQLRIPYEESSVFSKINVVNPDLKRFPQFRKAQEDIWSRLEMGQVMGALKHW